MEERLIYKLIDQYNYPITGQQPKKFFKKHKENKMCIFCGKADGEVTFRKEAHIIPAALGNRSLFNFNECDTCNEQIFSVHENELLNYLQLERIMIRGRPRSGAPKYRPANAKSFISSTPETNLVTISVDQDERIFEIIEHNEHTLTLKCNNPPSYSLAAICKALIHMAWCVLPEETRNKFPYVFRWLNGDIKMLPLYLDKAFIPGGGMSNVVLELWESSSEDSSNYPLLVRLTYGHKVLTFYLPKDTNVILPPAPFLYLKNIPDNIHIEGVQDKIISEDRMKLDDCSFTMNYSRQERISNQ